MNGLIQTQKLPIGIEEAWHFFSNPENLARITPPGMDFKITSEITPGTAVYPGMIITYTLKPIFGLAVNWATEITHVNQKRYFVDTQLSGPYKFWHHQHHFKKIEGGVEMMDTLYYAMPFGFIGKLLELMFVNRRVRQIFDYRQRKLEALFGEF